MPLTEITRCWDLILIRKRLNLLDSTGAASTMKREREAAFERFKKDMPTSNEDHLDANLELEREYLCKYLAFLKGP